MNELLHLYRETLPVIEAVFDFLESRLGRVILTVLILFMATFINRFMHWRLAVKKTADPSGDLRATWVRRRNMVWVTAVLLILALWSNQITGFLISLAAIGGALLVVSKEFILCVWGALIISLNKSLKIGSTIEIGQYTGQLVNTGFVSFELAEIGPSKKQTGRLLQLPNSLIFQWPLKNLSAYGAYGIHLIDFHFDRRVNIQRAENLVLKLANEAGKHWILEAERHFTHLENSHFVDLPKAQPEVFWNSVDEKCLRMTLRLGCPLNKRGQLEKAVVKRFWVEYLEHAVDPNTQAQD
ncbi:mechanosensitive ion channel family protein [Limnobacter humi]|uniref:Mechanosensitive ion channel family protein n=1 Tax=Limnobacter humi TaxID=1778671 RepID=A0ABT1WH05_9BURK|nr:mechanosensitive ion channel domain-containing protein [Limnobacter humi]MCQ8896138.1 mechanosensitive ion channel family protein [Limnobacter humi]